MKLLHKTSYKNLWKTCYLSLFGALILFMLSCLLLQFEIAVLLSTICFAFFYTLLGRNLIVRHTISENFNIHIEYLLRPKKNFYLTRKEVKNIQFQEVNRGRHGMREKGKIVLKSAPNYHLNYTIFSIKDEPLWFWSNFKFPNKIETNANKPSAYWQQAAPLHSTNPPFPPTEYLPLPS